MTDYIFNAISLIFQNAFQLSLADGIIFVILLMALIFSIQDFRIGLMFMFLINICGYIFYTLNGFPLGNITMMIFVSLLLMAFSIFFSKSNPGGMIG